MCLHKKTTPKTAKLNEALLGNPCLSFPSSLKTNSLRSMARHDERSMSRHGSVTPSVRSEDSQVSHLAQDLTLQELRAFVEKKTKENFYLTIENEIFEKYLQKRDPGILKGQSKGSKK
uniref:Uncharacterized protein n=1 Tax=Cacopsylla melanoneura TaxID=428564 RepID=A0A8D8WRP7_9HEMI